MSEPKNIVTYSAAATLNLNGNEGLVVYLPAGGSWGVRRATGPTVEPLGIIWNADNSSGGDVAVALDGTVCWAVAGGAFTPTSTKWAMATASGRITPLTNSDTNYIVGRILAQADVASGDLVPFLVLTSHLSA